MATELLIVRGFPLSFSVIGYREGAGVGYPRVTAGRVLGGGCSVAGALGRVLAHDIVSDRDYLRLTVSSRWIRGSSADTRPARH